MISSVFHVHFSHNMNTFVPFRCLSDVPFRKASVGVCLGVHSLTTPLFQTVQRHGLGRCRTWASAFQRIINHRTTFSVNIALETFKCRVAVSTYCVGCRSQYLLELSLTRVEDWLVCEVGSRNLGTEKRLKLPKRLFKLPAVASSY